MVGSAVCVLGGGVEGAGRGISCDLHVHVEFTYQGCLMCLVILLTENIAVIGKADKGHSEGLSEVGPDPVVLSEREAKGISQTEASGPSRKQDKPSQQDEPSRSSDTSETSSQGDDRSRRPSSDDTKKVCVYVWGGGGGDVHVRMCM